MKYQDLQLIGRAEKVNFPELGLNGVPARIDTGAKTSAIWASSVKEKDGTLEFVLFGKKSPFYTGKKLSTRHYTQRMISSSTGTTQSRYVVRLLIELKGKKIRASFSLANRSKQVYPVLIGRRVLRGKFLVDVKSGTPLLDEEHKRSSQLQAGLRVRKELT